MAKGHGGLPKKPGVYRMDDMRTAWMRARWQMVWSQGRPRAKGQLEPTSKSQLGRGLPWGCGRRVLEKRDHGEARAATGLLWEEELIFSANSVKGRSAQGEEWQTTCVVWEGVSSARFQGEGMDCLSNEHIKPLISSTVFPPYLRAPPPYNSRTFCTNTIGHPGYNGTKRWRRSCSLLFQSLATPGCDWNRGETESIFWGAVFSPF